MAAQTIPEWTPPETIAEGERLRLEYVERLQEIQTLLGDRSRLLPNGRRMSYAEFVEWRRRRMLEQAAVQRTVQRLKAWVKDQRARTQILIEGRKGAAPDLRDPREAIAAVLNIAKQVEDITPQEQDAIDEVSRLLMHGDLILRKAVTTPSEKPFPYAANQKGVSHWNREGAAACGAHFSDDRLVRAGRNVTCVACRQLVSEDLDQRVRRFWAKSGT